MLLALRTTVVLPIMRICEDGMGSGVSKRVWSATRTTISNLPETLCRYRVETYLRREEGYDGGCGSLS